MKLNKSKKQSSQAEAGREVKLKWTDLGKDANMASLKAGDEIELNHDHAKEVYALDGGIIYKSQNGGWVIEKVNTFDKRTTIYIGNAAEVEILSKIFSKEATG